MMHFQGRSGLSSTVELLVVDRRPEAPGPTCRCGQGHRNSRAVQPTKQVGASTFHAFM